MFYEILLFYLSVAIATALWLVTIKFVVKSNIHSITLNLIPNTWNFDVLFKCYRHFYKTQRRGRPIYGETGRRLLWSSLGDHNLLMKATIITKLSEFVKRI